MDRDYAALSNIPLQPGASFHTPPPSSLEQRLDLPALDFMTDFKLVTPVTCPPGWSIDTALETMKGRGVRLLLVVDDVDTVIGLVTSNDIQGEKPIEVARSNDSRRADIKVDQVMTPQSDITSLNLISIRNARVGHIIGMHKRLGRQHLLVVEVTGDDSNQTIRGLFSTSQIARQLGIRLSPGDASAHSLAEMVQQLG